MNGRETQRSRGQKRMRVLGNWLSVRSEKPKEGQVRKCLCNEWDRAGRPRIRCPSSLLRRRKQCYLEHAWECGRLVLSTASQQPGCQLSGLICRWTSCLDRYRWQNRNPTNYSVFQISNDPSLCPQITHPKLSVSSRSSERLLLTDETPGIFVEKRVWMWQVEFYN